VPTAPWAGARSRLESGQADLPHGRRRALGRTWVSDLLIAQTPQTFTDAIACLLDDEVAEKSYEAMFKCRRGEAL
jgi:hypothetical protein